MPIEKLAVALPDFGASQLSYEATNAMNWLLSQTAKIDCCGFYQTKVKPSFQTNFALMPISELWGHDGCAIVTTFDLARIALRVHSLKRIIFLAYDLEWATQPGLAESEYALVYKNTRLELAVRSQSHQQAFYNAWDKSPKVIDNFDLVQLLSNPNDC